jgi:phosphoesterase RecJ-like protein
LALYHALGTLGKKVTIYVPDLEPEFFAFLPGIEHFTTVKPAVADFDAVIVLDYTQLNRTNMEAEVLAHPRTIAIDHHYDNPKQAKCNVIVPEAAATAQILYELLVAIGISLTPAIATCLLTGIFTDTGSFMHDSTTPDILEIASDLMNRGARLSHIAHETYQKKDLPGLRIWGKTLSRIITNEKTGASVSIITYNDLKECGATFDDLSGVVSMINTLPQTKFAMLLVEYVPGKIKGSLRSEPHKKVDVSKIAKSLGGGGHKLASGFEIPGHLVEKEGKWHIVPAAVVE